MSTGDRYRDVAASFNEYLKDFFAPADNHTTYHFGYKPVLDIIRETKGFPDISLVDYGSGAGQFCAYLKTLNVQTIGFELSDSMLQTAKSNFPDMSDRFFSTEELSADYDAKFDICTMNFVTCEIPDEKTMDSLLSNAYRLIKPEGKLIILTNNPEANPAGANYNIWSVGPVDVSQEGTPIKITIHTGDTSFDLDDFFWSKEFMLSKLQEKGFNQASSYFPKLEQAEQNIWKDELKYPPTLIYTAVKP